MQSCWLAVLLLAGPVSAISDELGDSFQKLKEAEANKDAALVKKFAVETRALARREAAAPAPESPTDKEFRAKRLTYLRDVEAYTEYSLYAIAVQSAPAATVDLLATLEEQNSASKYLDEAYARYFFALNQTGGSAKVPSIAERALKNFPENEDLLLILADSAMNRKQTDRASNYAERLIAVMAKHGKPEGMSAADWERKRSAAIGRSRWIAGVAHSEKGQHFEADKDLRAALPLIKGNDNMTASALFYLGVANYQLGASMRDRTRILEAAKFSDQAATIKGPLSQHAWRNAQAMRAEAQKLR
jgi:hypothetical protein